MFKNLQLATATLPDADALVYEPLDSRYIRIMRIGSALLWMVVLAAVWVIYLIADEPKVWLPVFLALSAALLLGLIGNQSILHRAFQYRGIAMREHDVTYRSGLFMSRETSVPYRRVQQVVLSQNWPEKRIGLYSIKIQNAADASAHLRISGLGQERAERIKAFILSHIVHDEGL